MKLFQLVAVLAVTALTMASYLPIGENFGGGVDGMSPPIVSFQAPKTV
jgi:hypothetical protein